MSAPNVSLYALTIMAQPSFMEENPDVNSFQRLHRKVYLPCMHFLFSLCILGMIASVTSLSVRWEEFRKQPFSPAHAAFLCPTLSHANAVQGWSFNRQKCVVLYDRKVFLFTIPSSSTFNFAAAYRGALMAFSTLHHHSVPLVALYTYWVIVLVGGTIAYLCIATRYLLCLPGWTHFDLVSRYQWLEKFRKRYRIRAAFDLTLHLALGRIAGRGYRTASPIRNSNDT